MGALAGSMGGGGGASVQTSATASSGPQTGETGNLVLNFGGINLGNQDIPLSASSANPVSNSPATVGTLPNIGVQGMQYLPYVLLIGAAVALFYWMKSR